MRAACRPAYDSEALDRERRDHLLGTRAEGPAADGRAAPVDSEQPHAELRCDRVVRMTGQARVATAVHVDDGRAVGVADVVQPHLRRTSRTRAWPRPS